MPRRKSLLEPGIQGTTAHGLNRQGARGTAVAAHRLMRHPEALDG